MKNIFRFLLAVAAVAAILLAPAPCRAQVTPGYNGAFTNLAATFASTNTTTATTNVLVLRQNSGLALQSVLGCTATGPAGLWVWFSVDGTNYPATPTIITGTVGTTATTIQTNWSPAALAGFYSVKLQLTNGAAGTLTNQQTIYRQWPAPLGY